jgi:hypothetical protein
VCANEVIRLLHMITAIFHEVKDHHKNKKEEEKFANGEMGQNDYGN